MLKKMDSLTLRRCFVLAALLVSFAFQGKAPSTESVALAQAGSSDLQSVSTADFEWSMPERFGPKDKNDLVDYHWDRETHTYDPSFVNPKTWRVDFDACKGSGQPGNVRSYTWEIRGQSFVVTDSCKFTYDKFNYLGNYPVKLTVTTKDGQSSSVLKDVNVKDILIVSIGDSFASGQGNPDIKRDKEKKIKAEWIYSRCHRSAKAGPAKAALRIEQADPHTSVTFISYACSGAEIQELIGAEQKLGVKRLSPQIYKVRTAVAGRRIDALLVSIGGNDVYFSRLVIRAIRMKDVAHHKQTNDLFNKGLKTLASGFRDLADEIATLFAMPKVFITEYPDLVRDADGKFCANTPANDSLLKRISREEAEWASQTVIGKLNCEVRSAANKFGWVYVDGIAPSFLKHGYCAGEQSWVNTFGDAERIQGNAKCLETSLGDCIISPGSVHPNERGHDCFATRIILALLAKGIIASSPELIRSDDVCAAPSIPSIPTIECPATND